MGVGDGSRIHHTVEIVKRFVARSAKFFTEKIIELLPATLIKRENRNKNILYPTTITTKKVFCNLRDLLAINRLTQSMCFPIGPLPTLIIFVNENIILLYYVNR